MSVTTTKTLIPLKERDKEYYRLDVTHNLPPGTDTIDQLEKNPRLPRPPATPKRPLPELPPESERKGKWIAKYLDTLDPETEYDQIVRISAFYGNTDFNTALGYTCVFVWLTSTPAGANAIHGGKVINRGHQRYYETQELNLQWVYWGAGSAETKEYVEKINKVHQGVWSRVPGAFAFAWEAQAAIILLSWYETYIRRIVGAKNPVHPQLKRAWPEWGERLTSHFNTEPSVGALPNFGVNYPRNWKEIEGFTQWFIDLDIDDQRTEEDIVKGHETSEAFIHQFNELWFPRPLHFLGRALILTFLPPKIRQKQRLEDPNAFLEWLIKAFFRFGINSQDSKPDPVTAPMEKFFAELQTWDLTKMDVRETTKRDAESRRLATAGWGLLLLMFGVNN